MNAARSHLFWGAFSPLGGLAGGGLLIMASARLAWALSVSGALLWVYFFSVLLSFPGSVGRGRKIYPRQGKSLVLIFLASFIGSIYLLLLWFLCPLAALEVFFPLCLTPLFCTGSGLFKRIEPLDLGEALFRAVSEALVVGGLLIVLALIREPLGFSSLSLPGSAQGIVLLFSFKAESFLPVRIIASSAGALLLLGYCAGLYRYFKSIYAPREGDQ
ncbi:hypothetical protein AGMMS50293_20250 [Spirochaetia bacterium]|nr:hypothetical protein AGMMS50293_20250 [Spirochaetia bacterium]